MKMILGLIDDIVVGWGEHPSLMIVSVAFIVSVVALMWRIQTTGGE